MEQFLQKNRYQRKKVLGHLKTETILHLGEKLTICFGHIDVGAFKVAFKNEGYGGDNVTEDRLSYEYWAKGSKGWHPSNKHQAGAFPVTVMEW